uniref:F-type ATPase subunit delta n=1 Tax=Meloidogyne hapla TaxID=6305 RepID=A0A1I8BG36_MELHA
MGGPDPTALGPWSKQCQFIQNGYNAVGLEILKNELDKFLEGKNKIEVNEETLKKLYSLYERNRNKNKKEKAKIKENIKIFKQKIKPSKEVQKQLIKYFGKSRPEFLVALKQSKNNKVSNLVLDRVNPELKVPLVEGIIILNIYGEVSKKSLRINQNLLRYALDIYGYKSI